LELEGGRDNSRLLGLGLGGGDTCLKGGEGSDLVGRRGGNSRGGSSCRPPW
jgi:hypothetical protein